MRDVLSRFTASELSEWRLFYRLDDQTRTPQLLATAVAMLANRWVGRRDQQAYAPTDFLPKQVGVGLTENEKKSRNHALSARIRKVFMAMTGPKKTD